MQTRKRSKKSAVFYFVSLVAILLFFFFTNDFGMLDIQKTAIVTAVGIDREGEEFLLTTQIAVPQASKQGEQVEPVQIESRAATVAEAFSEVNAKTGWYPKLVFCNLIVLGKTAVERDAFEALDFFLRNDYAPDNCLVTTCEGSAKEIIEANTPIEKISGLAVQKLLSDHSARVGSVLPSTLKRFATDYFSDGESGYLPLVKKENSAKTSSEGQKQNGDAQQKKPDSPTVFSAGQTALFSRGVMTGVLDERQTFALAAVKEKLRLASYGVENAGSEYTLLIKKNAPKIRLKREGGNLRLEVKVNLVAGVDDVATPHTPVELGTDGKIPPAVFRAAEKRLQSEIESAFETGKACGCDIFDAVSLLKRKHYDYFAAYKDDLLDRISVKVSVKFSPLR